MMNRCWYGSSYGLAYKLCNQQMMISLRQIEPSEFHSSPGLVAGMVQWISDVYLPMKSPVYLHKFFLLQCLLAWRCRFYSRGLEGPSHKDKFVQRYFE